MEEKNDADSRWPRLRKRYLDATDLQALFAKSAEAPANTRPDQLTAMAVSRDIDLASWSTR